MPDNNYASPSISTAAHHRTLTSSTARLALATVFLLAPSVVPVSLIGDSGQAVADCNGVNPGPFIGTAGPDTVSCDNAPPPAANYDVNTLGGGDTITVDGGTYDAINTGKGDDVVVVNSGNVGFILDFNTPDGFSDSGNDTYTINAGAGTIGTMAGGDGEDIFNINGGTITSIQAGDDADTVTMTGGSVEDLDTDDGDDSVSISGGTVGAGDETSLSTGEGADTISLTGGAITQDIDAGNGEDIITLTSGTVGDDVFGQGDNDTITLNGATVEDNIEGGAGDDTINIQSGIVADILGNAGEDIINISGGTVEEEVFGGDNDDTLNLTGGTVGGGGVFGGANNDMITLDGATVNDQISGSSGNDMIVLESGSAGRVFGGDDDDTITLDGTALVNGDIFGDRVGNNAADGKDTINLFGGLAQNVFAGGENDLIMLAGSTIALNIEGQNGDDRFAWSSGTMAAFLGGDGSDDALVTAAEYDASQLLDGGDDVSTADGWVDMLELQGLAITADSTDIINWEIAILSGTNFTTGDGALIVGSDPLTGLFLTNGSNFDALASFELTGNLNIDDSSIFDATGGGGGVYSISSNVTNAGTIRMQDDATATSSTLRLTILAIMGLLRSTPSWMMDPARIRTNWLLAAIRQDPRRSMWRIPAVPAV